LPAAGHARGAQQCLAGFGVLNLAFAGRFAGPVFWADFWAGRKASAESAHVQPSLDLKILRFAFGAMGLRSPASGSAQAGNLQALALFKMTQRGLCVTEPGQDQDRGDLRHVGTWVNPNGFA